LVDIAEQAKKDSLESFIIEVALLLAARAFFKSAATQ
jgi:hypothetical protein